MSLDALLPRLRVELDITTSVVIVQTVFNGLRDVQKGLFTAHSVFDETVAPLRVTDDPTDVHHL